MQTEKIKKVISESKNICIASHMNPDGDNLGSICAVYNYLINENKDVFLIIDDFIPKNYHFLPNINRSVKSESIDFIPDLFIALDCADIGRLGKNCRDLFLKSNCKLNIDHHKTNTNFGDFNIVDSSSPATGEVLFNLFKDLDYKLNKDIATCLYAAISSDTGSFKYDSVRPATFVAASHLLEYGIDKNEIAVNLYQKRSLEKTKLLINAVNTMELFDDDKIAVVYVDDEMIENCGAVKSDTEGIVEFIRDIDDVEVAIFMKIKKSSIKLSIRTKSHVDATKIAEFYGG
ncbi:MAG: bifunctional oligoribonuclease/PAP phosphatase NrnA, partial [Peptoniphilus sp.]|nr:bifunctional oligoribonuclease/PAP phosphatase NrnA [Peptoniphilus sp.]